MSSTRDNSMASTGNNPTVDAPTVNTPTINTPTVNTLFQFCQIFSFMGQGTDY